MKKYAPKALISFITATLLAAVIFALSGIYPGSERTLLVFDMLEQFASFYSSVRSVIFENGSFSYTFMGSLGTPYVGMFAYYLASPFSLLTLLFDVRDMPDAIWLMDILKCGMIAASFSLLMTYREVKSTAANVALSLAYALSSSAVTFFLLPMYLDTMYMLPIICIFLERLLKTKPEKSRAPMNPSVRFGLRSNEEARKIIESNFEMNDVARRGIAYSVTLALSMYFHYYSAYMVCLFLVMYTVFILTENMEEKPDFKDMGLRFMNFVFYSIFGAILASPLLLPVFKELSQGKSMDPGVYSDGSFIVTSFPDILKQFICGHFGSLYSEGAPAIYFTVIILVLGVYGIVKGRKNRACTVCSSVIVIIFLLSFMMRPLYRVWHIFRDPVAYPHRFAFLFVFFMVVMASKALPLERIMNRIPGKVHALTEIGAVLIIASLLVLNGYKITSAIYGEYPNSTRSSYVQLIDMMADIIDYAKEYDRSIEREGVSLCRLNKDIEITSNDPMLLGFNGMDYFSSSYNAGMLSLYKDLGILQYHYKACDRGSNIVTDMLLGIDYELYFTKPEYGYDFVYSNGFSSLYHNPYSLGLGYLACDDTCRFGGDPFANQNSFIGSVLGREVSVYDTFAYTENERVIDGVQVTDSNGDYVITPMPVKVIQFNPPIGENLYLNFELLRESELDYDAKTRNEEIQIVLNDHGTGNNKFNGYQRSSNMYLGTYYENDNFVLDIYDYGDDRRVYLYSLDTDTVADVFAEISEGRFIADSVNNGVITGHVTVTDENRNNLIFTVPYSNCFKAYADGVRVPTDSYAGALLTIPDLAVGEHEIRIEYKP